LLAAGEDVAVGELVRARYGDQIVDRLVDPLLGGIYAGRADRLSLAVTIPQLARAARIEHTLRAAVRSAQAEAAARRAPGRPVFGALDGGMSRLVAAAATASGARISLGLPVREMARTRDGWRLVLGPVLTGRDPNFDKRDPQIDVVDAVVLAVPSKAATRLLTGVAPEAAAAIGVLDYASVALVGMAFPAGTVLPELSGFLVPPSEGTLVKAATFVTRKWDHLAGPGDPVLVRVSLGRAGEAERLQFDDAVLTERAHHELGELIGRPLPAPEETFLQRWGGGLPQYPPGHLDRVAQVREALPPGLAVAGASLDGVGIPACVAAGERAAEDVHKVLEEGTP
jgi:oxygen-dependent protoporphyrinogen oxidase